jgi:hypothetical protein
MTQVTAALEAREAQAVKLGANQVIVIGDDSPDSPPAVTLELVDVSELHEDEDNARRGSVDEIDRSLEEFGQHRFCVATRDGRIVVGNHLYRTALRRGWKKIFVQWVDDDYNKGTRRGLADNRTGELAEWDLEVLAALHGSIDISDVPGFDAEALAAMLPAERTLKNGEEYDESIVNGKTLVARVVVTCTTENAEAIRGAVEAACTNFEGASIHIETEEVAI